MPCPAIELGAIGPFGPMQEFNGKTFVATDSLMARVCVWRGRARHAVPLLSEKTNAEERGRDRGKDLSARRVAACGTGRNACATERRANLFL
jgi:hypothetical protein